MSGVRKHFCTVVRSGAGGCSRPRKKGISGCIPAVVSSVERSSARGTSEAEGRKTWPFDSKKARKPARRSADVRIRGLYEGLGRVRFGHLAAASGLRDRRDVDQAEEPVIYRPAVPSVIGAL